MHAEQPDGVERHPGGFQRAEDLYLGGEGLRLEYRIPRQRAQLADGLAKAHARSHLAECGEFTEQPMKAFELLELVTVEGLLSGPAQQPEQSPQVLRPAAW